MAKLPQRWYAAPTPRLIACLAASALLHAGSIALLASEWSATKERPAIAPTLEVRLKETPPQVAPVPYTDPLVKDTLADSPASPAASAAISSAAQSGAARRASDTARARAAQRKLAEHIFYPPEAVAAGIEGEVRLLLTLDSAGNVVEASIASSSGHPLLDRAALSAAHAMQRLPNAGVRELILPVVFRLE